MTLATANALWGAEVVERALDDTGHEGVTATLAAEIEARADPPGAFRAWALSQPWPTFCAIVRVVAGVTREDLIHGR